jgi:hypothetical protein
VGSNINTSIDEEEDTVECMHPMNLAAKANSQDNPTWNEAMNGLLKQGDWEAAKEGNRRWQHAPALFDIAELCGLGPCRATFRKPSRTMEMPSWQPSLRLFSGVPNPSRSSRLAKRQSIDWAENRLISIRFISPMPMPMPSIGMALPWPMRSA